MSKTNRMLLMIGVAAAIFIVAMNAPVFAADDRAAAVDLRPAFAKWDLVPRVQGKRGTCSAFAVTESIEYALAHKQGRGTRLSVEFLNWASNRATKTAEDGGFFSDLWKGYLAYGICPEADMPYLDHFDPAIEPSNRAMVRAKEIRALGLRLHWIKEWDPKKGLSAEQLAALKQSLRRGWPVCGGCLWPKRERWENGVLQMCPREGVFDGHSVLLVGFRDDAKQPGGGVLLIRNSSGKSRDGLMSYEFARAYMNDAAWVDDRGAAEDRPTADGSRPKPAGRSATHYRRMDLQVHPQNDVARDGPGGPSYASAGTALDSDLVASPDLLFRDPLGALTAPLAGRNRRVSSNEQPNWNDANLDMTWLQPGQVLELPFSVEEAGRYAIRLTALQGPQYGRYGIEIDGREVGDGNFGAAEEGGIGPPGRDPRVDTRDPRTCLPRPRRNLTEFARVPLLTRLARLECAAAWPHA